MNTMVLIIILIIAFVLLLLVACAEVILYLTSNGHANLDFAMKNYKKTENEKKRDELIAQDTQWLQTQNTKEYFIKSRDGFKLRALYVPAKETDDSEQLKNSSCNDAAKSARRIVLCSHGVQSNGVREFATAARYFCENGISSLLIDQRACGKSEGKYVTYGEKESGDCREWIDFIIREFGDDCRICVYGLSMGSSTAVLLGNYELPSNVDCVVADSGYASAKQQILYTFKDVGVPAGICYFLYKAACICHNIYNPDKVDITSAASKFKIPVLLIHSKDDKVVPVENVYRLYDAWGCEDKKMLLTEGLDHVQSFALSMEIREAVVDRMR